MVGVWHLSVLQSRPPVTDKELQILMVVMCVAGFGLGILAAILARRAKPKYKGRKF
jgi:hypothetical protein